MPPDDAIAQLVNLAKRGDGQACDKLVAQFLRPAYSIALAIVARPADAEDIAQDALVTAFEKLDSCREPARFASWLFQIVRNQSRNWLDKRRYRDVSREESSFDGPSHQADSYEAMGLRDQLVGALTHLGPVQREVVLLHDLEDWTHLEIGETLGISELMSRQHLFNARKVLRTLLAEGPEVDHDSR